MKRLLLIGLAILSLAQVGCKENQKPNDQDGKLSIGISSSIAGTAVTRAEASKESFAAGDTIGVFVTIYQNATTPGRLFGAGNFADNVRFIAQSDATIFKPTTADRITFPNSTTKVDVFAFGLYDAKYNDLGTDPTKYSWTMSADQNTAAKVLANDLMTAQQLGVAPTTANVPLTFHHRFSKVDIHFTAPALYKGQDVQSAKMVYVTNTKVKAVVNMADTLVVPTLVAVQDTVSIEAFQASSTGLTYQYEAIVVPQSVSAASVVARIVLNVGAVGNTKEVWFDCITPGELIYKAGNKSKLTLVFEGESEVRLAGVTIAPWGQTADNTSVAKLPARQLFEVTSGTASAVTSALLTIDGITYKSAVSISGNILTCTYLQNDGHRSASVQSIDCLNASGTRIKFFSGPWIVRGRPTDDNYSEVTGQLNF